jgi:hypothetical protein
MEHPHSTNCRQSKHIVSWCLISQTHCRYYDVCCMYTWLPVAVPFLASLCFRLCEDPKQCSSILIWVLLGFDKTLQERRPRIRFIMFHKVINEKYRYPYTKYITTESVYDKIFPERLIQTNPSCTFSSEFMFSFVWGSQTVQQYSNLGLIRVWYARSAIY